MVALVLVSTSAEILPPGAHGGRLVRSFSQVGTQPAVHEGMSSVVALCQEFFPRISVCGIREIACDARGLDRLFGDAHTLGRELCRAASDRGLHIRVAMAGTCTAARILAHHRAGLTTIVPGTEAAAVAPLPLRLLAALEPDAREVSRTIATVQRWGLTTLGELAALPAAAVRARLGADGVRWQRLARGEDLHPLVPDVPEERFEQALDLEWPIEGLEPLSFVLGRLMEPLAAHLERKDRGVAVLRVRLHLVTRDIHERALELPAAIRDARTLRTLALLDLESHPPVAAIDRVVVAVEPTPARVLQFSLLTRPLPEPAQLSTLLARVQAVMGEGRCGAPALVDSWAPGASTMVPFSPVEVLPVVSPPRVAVVALRRFREPIPVRVREEAGRPVHVVIDRHRIHGGMVKAGDRAATGGQVMMSAGPWRSSGGWWEGGEEEKEKEKGKEKESSASPESRSRESASWNSTSGDSTPGNRAPGDRASWDRDEWEVALRGGVCCRVFRERRSGGWFIEALID